MGVAVPVAALALTAIGTGYSVYAGASQAAYQAQVAKNNAQIATNNASNALQAGAQQEQENAMKTRAALGGELAAQASNGLDVNSGSNLLVRSSTSALGQLSGLTIRNNAARQAYGYEEQASGDTAQGSADIAAGTNSAISSTLSGATQEATQYTNFQKTGAFLSPAQAQMPN